VFLPGSASPFRGAKTAIAITGIVAVVALGIIARLRRGTLAIPRGALTAVLVALPALQLASAAWSTAPRITVSSAIYSTIWVVLILWMATIEEQDRRRLVVWCSVGVAVSAAVLVLQAVGVQPLPLADTVTGRMRLTGLAGNPADLSMAAALMLPLLLFHRREGGRPWPEWILLGVLVTGIAVSQTLTGYGALVAVAVVWLLLSRSWKLWLVSGVVAVMLGGFALSTGLTYRLENKLEQIQGGDWYALLTARGDGWTAAAEMIQTRPLSGVGAGSFTHRYYPSRLDWLESRGATGRRGERATHFEWVHCDPLQHVAELGVLGFVWIAALGWALVRVRRGSPALLALAVAATAPFLLLHYPTHLAVGLLPIALVMAHLMAGDNTVELGLPTGVLKHVASVALLGLVIAAAMWQLRSVALDLWHAQLERQLAAVSQLQDSRQRAQLAAAIERQTAGRLVRLRSATPWLLRVTGRARLARGDSRGAEQAFRAAYDVWPHEEAEFGLGIALNAQGRRNEALIHLGRVCRVNPSLTRNINDPDLRRAVSDLIRARSARQ
jgi:O-antigen ligase